MSPYACKITDAFSEMKEVYLLRKKFETTEAIHAYNMHVAATGGDRIETIRCDKRGENTGQSSATTARTQQSSSSTPLPTRPNRSEYRRATGKR